MFEYSCTSLPSPFVERIVILSILHVPCMSSWVWFSMWAPFLLAAWIVSCLIGVFRGRFFSAFSLLISAMTAIARSPYFSASSSIVASSGVGHGVVWMLGCCLSVA